MTIRLKRAHRAAQLRARGMPYRKIAERLAISTSYASNLVNDPDGELARARKRNYGRNCEICGARTNGSDGMFKAPRICGRCWNQKRHEERHWSPERILAAIRAWAAEHGRPPGAREWRHTRPTAPTTNTVVREFGSWANAIEAAGFPRPRSGVHGPRIDHTRVLQLAQEGMSDAEIAAQVGAAHRTVAHIRRGAGILLKSGLRTFDYGEAKRRFAAGESIRDLALEYGVSDNSVRRALGVQRAAAA